MKPNNYPDRLRVLVSTVLSCLCLCAGAQTLTTPITGGKLMTDLNGNSKIITTLNGITMGTGTAPGSAARLQFLGTPTTLAEGIQFGDVATTGVGIYRSASDTLTISADTLTVTGSISAGNLLTAGGNNTWTGSNTFNGAVSFGSTTTVGDSGLAFSATGKTATISALGLVKDTAGGVLSHNARLIDIGALTATDGNIMVGNGTTWVAESGATARTSLGLGTGSAVAFNDLTLAGFLAVDGGGSVGGLLTLTDASTDTTGLTLGIGGVDIWAPDASNMRIDGILTVEDGLKVGAGVLGTETLDLTPDGGVIWNTDTATRLHRTGAGALELDGSLNIDGSLTLDNPLAVTQGGTGLNAVTSGHMLYASGTNTLSTVATTSFGRSLLNAANASAGATLLGVGGGNSPSFTAVTITGGGTALDVTGNIVATGILTQAGNDVVDMATAMGGDVSGTVDAVVLDSTGVSAASYPSGSPSGTVTAIPTYTVDAKGRLTASGTAALAPGGSSDLTGNWPDSVVKANAIALATDTTGNYLAGVTSGSANSLTITNGTGAENATASLTLAQDIHTAATPTFADLTLSDDLVVGDDAAINGDLTVTGTLTATVTTDFPTGNVILVDPDSASATDTRTGLSRYSMDKPFATAAAALAVAVSGDLVWLRPKATAYPNLTVATAGIDFLLDPGAAVSGMSFQAAGSHRVFGGGRITNQISLDGSGQTLWLDVEIDSAGAGIDASSGTNTVHVLKPVTASSGDVVEVSASTTVNVHAPMRSTNASSAVADVAAGGVVNMLPGSAIINDSGASPQTVDLSALTLDDGPAWFSVEPNSMTAWTPSGTVATQPVLLVQGGVRAGNGKFYSAVTEATQVQIGPDANDVGWWSDTAGEIETDGTMKAAAATLTTPLPVASGGSGAATLTGILKGNGTSAFTAAVANTDYAATRTGVRREIWIPAWNMRANTALSGPDEPAVGSLSEYYEKGSDSVSAAVLPAPTTQASNTKATASFGFSSGTDAQVQFDHVFPTSWNAGTIKVKLYWYTTNSNTGSVVWVVKGVAHKSAEAMGDPLLSEATAQIITQAGSGTDRDIMITPASSALTVYSDTSSLEASDWILFSIARDADDAGDTYDSTAYLLGILIQYTENSAEPAAW